LATLPARNVGVMKMPSSIEWTDETWNPVTGCSKVSPGCDNCYMFAMYPRLKAMRVPGYEASPDVVQLKRDRLNLPLSWNKPRRVFVNSMSDAFHRDIPDYYLLLMFQVMKQSIDHAGHVFQILTKRPGRAVAWWQEHGSYFPDGWPENIWLGTSVENQKYAPRLTVLARVPAPVRFVSVEPLLGPVDLTAWLSEGSLSWVIAGGESGQRARSMDLKWLDSLKSQCEENSVPLFVKQLGTYWARGMGSSDPKGGSPADWPERIVSREYPIMKKPAIEVAV
jgi:protein gp37